MKNNDILFRQDSKISFVLYMKFLNCNYITKVHIEVIQYKHIIIQWRHCKFSTAGSLKFFLPQHTYIYIYIYEISGVMVPERAGK